MKITIHYCSHTLIDIVDTKFISVLRGCTSTLFFLPFTCVNSVFTDFAFPCVNSVLPILPPLIVQKRFQLRGTGVFARVRTGPARRRVFFLKWLNKVIAPNKTKPLT